MIIIRHKQDGGAWLFDETNDAALFMWGKDFKHYDVYVARKYTSKTSNIELFQKELEQELKRKWVQSIGMQPIGCWWILIIASPDVMYRLFAIG